MHLLAQAILAEAEYGESLQRLRAEEQDGSCTRVARPSSIAYTIAQHTDLGVLQRPCWVLTSCW